MNLRYLPLVSVLTVLLSTLPAASQGKVDKLKLNYQSARNQLGILSYCVSKGYIDDTAIDIQKKLIGRMWKPTDLSGGDPAEAAGRNGRITNLADIDADFEAVGKEQSGSGKAYCKEISDGLKEKSYLVR